MDRLAGQTKGTSKSTASSNGSTTIFDNFSSAMSIGSSIGTVNLPTQGVLKIIIVGASLSRAVLSNTEGPYATLTFGKSTRLKTNVSSGLCPSWNACFDLFVSATTESSFKKKTVFFTVKNKRELIGVANVKLLSLCAKKRTLLVPLKGTNGSQPGGMLKIRTNFEPWIGRHCRQGCESVSPALTNIDRKDEHERRQMPPRPTMSAASGHPPRDPMRTTRRNKYTHHMQSPSEAQTFVKIKSSSHRNLLATTRQRHGRESPCFNEIPPVVDLIYDDRSDVTSEVSVGYHERLYGRKVVDDGDASFQNKFFCF